MASKLKRVSQPAETAINAIAEREDRTFVAQLDRIVAAGLKALGEPVPAELEPTKPEPTQATTKRTRKAPVPANAS